MTGIAFGGKDLNWIYATEDGKLFRRPSLKKGIAAWVVSKPPNPPLERPSAPSLEKFLNYRFRLAAGLLLLVVACHSVWRTIGILSARRTLRTDLAEISHVRYGLLNADRWVEKLVPILNAQVDALDLTATNRASLKPTVVTALNRLLDQVKQQLAPKPAPGAGPAGFRLRRRA